MITLPPKLAAVVESVGPPGSEGYFVLRGPAAFKALGQSVSHGYALVAAKIHPSLFSLGGRAMGMTVHEVAILNRARVADCDDDEMKILSAWVEEQRPVLTETAA